MYVAIEGVIGVGKTTLARLLQNTFDAEILLEVFEENPFLSDFYSDRERYAFQTQIFFLLSRYHQQRRTVQDLLATGRNLLADYTFAKDALFAAINLRGDELAMYERVHEALGEKIPRPDLVVYLQADTDVLMQRIACATAPTNARWSAPTSTSSTRLSTSSSRSPNRRGVRQRPRRVQARERQATAADPARLAAPRRAALRQRAEPGELRVPRRVRLEPGRDPRGGVLRLS